MQGLAAIASPAAENDCDHSPCQNCGTPLAGPQSTDYRGLGRIEHSWNCHACGTKFRTSARMAGIVEFEPETVTVAAA